jgi:SAM-dependent methyltransferase
VLWSFSSFANFSPRRTYLAGARSPQTIGSRANPQETPPVQLLFELHKDMPRQAPGSDASTLRALKLLGPWPQPPEILDLGCGPGAHSLALARATGGRVTAVDLHQPYLEQLEASAKTEGLSHAITTVRTDMSELPFPSESYDLIWSEGAIYLVGFDHALREWARLLKPGGAIAVTEISWLTSEPPQELQEFWGSAYPAMRSVQGNLQAAAGAGFKEIDHFVLPDSDWWDGYYSYLEHRLALFRRDFGEHPGAESLALGTEREISLFRRFSEHYGYVFYLLTTKQT